MANEDIVLSRDAAIKANDTELSFRTGEARITYKVHETDNSNSGTATQARRGRGTLFINGEAQLDTTERPHATPFFIAKDEFIDMKLYPEGTGGDAYWSPTFLVNEFTLTSNAGDGGPVTYRFSGQSSGDFTKPGDT